jgi:Co/Zn/Cd efflux system component
MRGVKLDGVSRDYKTRLWTVIALNASMFAVEMGGGVMAGSQALQADARLWASGCSARRYGTRSFWARPAPK